MDETNIELKLNDHEHEIGSLKHRLDNVEKRQNALDKLAESIGARGAAGVLAYKAGRKEKENGK